MKKLTGKIKINQCYPDTVGVNTNLNVFPYMDSASRLYMEGNMVGKSVVTNGASTRMLTSGFEKQYGDVARSVVCPSDMTVEEVFNVKSSQGDGILSDGWKEIFVAFKNEDKNYLDLLVLPRFNAQNTYVGFEYVYDRDMIRRLSPTATFSKGEVFAKTPRISPSGEWMFSTRTIVCAMSSHATEEDGIVITDRYAREKMMCMFKHDRGFEWNESEWIPLNLYGTIDDPQPFAQPGERIRSDGIVMGFRRRTASNPLVSLTKKGLMQPDYAFDKLFRAPPSSILMDVKVEGEKLKDRSHNRSTDQIRQQHTDALKEHENVQNNFYLDIINWWERQITKNGGIEPEMSYELDRFIRTAYGCFSRRNNTLNQLSYSFKGIRQKDWKVKILLKEEVVGRVKFKLAGLDGDKGVAVKVIPWQDAPRYAGGEHCDIIINNTPAFRRQIMSMLNTSTINFINMQVHQELKDFRKQGNYKAAWDLVMTFYTSGFPEFADIVKSEFLTDLDKAEHIDYVCKDIISAQVRSDSELYGVNVVRELRKKFDYQLQKVMFRDSFGHEVESHYPILITTMDYLLLDKFGTDDSSQAFPKANAFGLPTSNSQADKYTEAYINKGSRNQGEAESRWMVAQKGPRETIKQLAIANSEIVRNNVVRRLIAAEDPFDIDVIVNDDEIKTNRALIMGADMLSDSGYILRHERPEDRDPS